jgi:hypothetical protein
MADLSVTLTPYIGGERLCDFEVSSPALHSVGRAGSRGTWNERALYVQVARALIAKRCATTQEGTLALAARAGELSKNVTDCR